MVNLVDTQRAAGDLQPLRDTHDFIAALPEDDPVAAMCQIAEALRAINAATTLTLEERYDDICLLDAVTVERTRPLLREYLTTSRHTRQRESDLWNSAGNGWRELADAYALCVQHYVADAAAASGFQKLARVSAARAMRALRRQLQWMRLRYAVPGAALWNGLAQLLVYAESEQVDEEVLIYPGEHTTVQREFLKALALAVLTGDNLLPPEQDLATYIVNHYAPHFVLSKTPDAGCTHSFDLKHPQAPLAIDRAVLPEPDLRYFGAGAAVVSLSEILHKLEQHPEVPAELGFDSPVDAAVLTPVLTQIHQDWSGNTPERRHTREKTNARVSVVPGFKAMLDALEQALADPFDFTTRTTEESWIASDISADGFGVLMPAVIGDWVSVGSVVGIEGEAAGEWAVGAVRRVRRLEGGQQHIGVQVLSRNAHAVRVMRESPPGANIRITQRLPVDHAILLTAEAAHQSEIELLVGDPTVYREGNVHVLFGDTALLVKLREVVMAAVDCTCIRCAVLSVET